MIPCVVLGLSKSHLLSGTDKYWERGILDPNIHVLFVMGLPSAHILCMLNIGIVLKIYIHAGPILLHTVSVYSSIQCIPVYAKSLFTTGAWASSIKGIDGDVISHWLVIDHITVRITIVISNQMFKHWISIWTAAQQ